MMTRRKAGWGPSYGLKQSSLFHYDQWLYYLYSIRKYDSIFKLYSSIFRVFLLVFPIVLSISYSFQTSAWARFLSRASFSWTGSHLTASSDFPGYFGSHFGWPKVIWWKIFLQQFYCQWKYQSDKILLLGCREFVIYSSTRIRYASNKRKLRLSVSSGSGYILYLLVIEQFLWGLNFFNLTFEGFKMVVGSEDSYLRKIELVFDLVMDRKFFLSNHSPLYGVTFVVISFFKI